MGITIMKQNKKGFTVVEMLSALLILLLVTLITTGGIAMASRQYIKQLRYAQARVLSSTINQIIIDDLRFTGHVANDGEGQYQIFSFNQTHNGYGTYSVDENGQIVFVSADGTRSQKIVSSNQYKYGLTSELSMNYNEQTHLFVVHSVIRNGSNILQDHEFSVKNVNQSQIAEK